MHHCSANAACAAVARSAGSFYHRNVLLPPPDSGFLSLPGLATVSESPTGCGRDSPPPSELHPPSLPGAPPAPRGGGATSEISQVAPGTLASISSAPTPSCITTAEPGSAWWSGLRVVVVVVLVKRTRKRVGDGAGMLQHPTHTLSGRRADPTASATDVAGDGGGGCRERAKLRLARLC